MEINLVEFDLASLEQLGGGAAVMQVKKLIEQAVQDLDRRPGEARERTISIKLKFEPVTRLEPIDERTNRTVLDGVKLKLEMDLKVPSRQTVVYDLGVSANGALVFNPDSPHNHRQAGLPFTMDGEASPTVPMTGT